MLDEDLSNSIKVTPLARAVWRNDFQVTDLLIKVVQYYYILYSNVVQM